MKKKTKSKKVKSKSSKAKKKTVKKKAVRKKSSKAKAVKRPKPAKAKVSAPKKPQIKGVLIGAATHYFPHVEAAVVKIGNGQIRAGDRLYFKGHTTDFEVTVSSMQIDRSPIEIASKGDEVGIQVPSRVREGDSVYKL